MLRNTRSPFMEAEEIAQALGLTRAGFMRRRNLMIVNEGMPAPLPGRTPKWHREGVERWLAQYGEMKARQMRGGGSMVRIQLDRAALERAYGIGGVAA